MSAKYLRNLWRSGVYVVRNIGRKPVKTLEHSTELMRNANNRRLLNQQLAQLERADRVERESRDRAAQKAAMEATAKLMAEAESRIAAAKQEFDELEAEALETIDRRRKQRVSDKEPRL